ncbi:MAG: hypothetical protein AB1405_13995, partial [Bdellovibrionota bacterium]
MKKLITVMAVLLTGFAERAFADGGCPSVPAGTYEGWLKKAKAAETAGKMGDALFYGRAAENMVVPGAREFLSNFAGRMGKQSETAGNLYGERELFDYRQDGACVQWTRAKGLDACKEPEPPGSCMDEERKTLRARIPAFTWYEEFGRFADADRVFLTHLSKGAPSLDLFEAAFNHFQGRKDNPPEGYKLDPHYLQDLRKIGKAQGDAAFAKEEKEYSRKEVDLMGGGGGPEDRSLAVLNLTRKWYAFFSESESKLIERALKRGDDLAKDEASPTSLQQALSYYEFAKRTDKQKDLRARARKLAEAAEAKGDTINSTQYYVIAGDSEKADKAGRKAGEKIKKNFEKGEGPLSNKSEAEKKKFK